MNSKYCILFYLMLIPVLSSAQNCKCKNLDDAFLRLSYNLNIKNQRIYSPIEENVIVNKDGISTIRYKLNPDLLLIEKCANYQLRLKGDSLTFLFDEEREKQLLNWLVENCH